MQRWEKIVIAVLILWLIQSAAFGIHYGCYPSGPHCGPPSNPGRHLFLGIEIAAGLILFSIGWLLLIGGIQRCGDAVDVVLDGNRNGWRRVGFWFCAAAGGAGLASSVVTYALSLYLAR